MAGFLKWADVIVLAEVHERGVVAEGIIAGGIQGYEIQADEWIYGDIATQIAEYIAESRPLLYRPRVVVTTACLEKLQDKRVNAALGLHTVVLCPDSPDYN